MAPAELPILTIDGEAFDDFAGFCREFSKLVAPNKWNGNLDAFNDYLRGGFGSIPSEGGYTLRWLASGRSRQVLGHTAWAFKLAQMLENCDPTNRSAVSEQLARARRGEGPTLFDVLVDIIQDHGEGGAEAEDGVVLELV